MTRSARQLVRGAVNRTARAAVAAASQLSAAAEKFAASHPDPRPQRQMQDITWFHSIDLGGGLLTPGMKSADQLALETQWLNLPSSLAGKSVLDIGAWDGYFSFEAERRGAARVVSLDHYVWSTDQKVFDAYHAAEKAAGRVPAPPDEAPGVWDPFTLPGRAGFDYAHRRLGSAAEPVVGDFMTMDLDRLGTFDITLFLGVLYHLKDPFAALRRLRQVTGGVAVIETASVVIPGWAEDNLWLFLSQPNSTMTPAIGGRRAQRVWWPRAARQVSATPRSRPLPANTPHQTPATACTTAAPPSTPTSNRPYANGAEGTWKVTRRSTLTGGRVPAWRAGNFGTSLCTRKWELSGTCARLRPCPATGFGTWPQ